jgi:hypothetical protein
VSKTLLVLSAFAVLLLITTEGLAMIPGDRVEGRNPIVYSPNGNEVGVLRRFMPGGLAVMQPSRKTLGMGHYNVVLSQQDLRPRARGGWETDLTLDQIAYLPPVNPNRFWMPSGV